MNDNLLGGFNPIETYESQLGRRITGWWLQPHWKIWKSALIIVPNIWKNRKQFQTTNQIRYCKDMWWDINLNQYNIYYERIIVTRIPPITLKQKIIRTQPMHWYIKQFECKTYLLSLISPNLFVESQHLWTCASNHIWLNKIVLNVLEWVWTALFLPARSEVYDHVWTVSTCL